MTLKKRYSLDKAFFDFPVKKKISGETITRRLQSIVSRSMLSGRNLPVKPNFSLFSPKCYCNRNLYFFLPPTPRFLRRSSALNINLNHVRESFKFARTDFCREPDLPEYETRLPLRLSNHIRQKKEQGLFFSSFSQTQAPKIKELQLESFAQIEKSSGFLPIIPDIFPDSIVPPVLPAKVGQAINFPSIYKSQMPQKLFVNGNLALGLEQPSGLKNELALAKPSGKHFPITYQNPVFQRSDSFISQQKAVRLSAQICTVMQPARAYVFDNRTEIGKNLILEVETQAKCLCGNDRPIEKTGFLSRMAYSQSPAKNFSFSARIKSKSPRLTLDFRGLPKERITGKCKLEKIFNSNDRLLLVSKDTKVRTGLKINWNPLRPRLRLKLKKFLFSAPEPSMHLLPGQKSLPTKAFLKDLPAQRNFRWQKPLPRPTDWQYRQDRLPQKTVEESFKYYRFPLFFMTRKHARYCLSHLKKIRIPTLPIKPAQIDLRRMFLPGNFAPTPHYSRNFIAAPGLFSDSVMILGRPALFLMTVTSLNFTDISLPYHLRKVKSPNGHFHLPISALAMPSAQRQLQRLSFSLQSEHTFVELKSKRTRIRFVRRHLQLFKPAKNLSQVKERFTATHKSIPQKAFQHNLLFEKKLHSISGLPQSIVKSLPLTLAPILPDQAVSIEQRHIIPPPEWPKAETRFNCRLRLLPYPFGFPTFNQPEFLMKSILNDTKTEILSTRESSIKAQGYNYSLNRRIYSSKYSLKNPVKWLFPEVSRAVFRLFPVLPRNAALPIDHLLTPIPAPKSFNFSWQNETVRMPELVDYFSHHEKGVQHADFSESANMGREKWTEITLPTPKPRAKKISRLLLKQSKSFCRKLSGRISRANLVKIMGYGKKFRFDEPQILPSLPLAQRESLAAPKAKEILAFYFQFPATTLMQEDSIQGFKALFRQFHFPYTPVNQKILARKMPYFELDDTSNLVAFAAGEEIRVSQIKDNEDLKRSQVLETGFSLVNLHKERFVHRFQRDSKSAYNIRSNEKWQLSTIDLKWHISAIPSRYLCLKSWKFNRKKVAPPTVQVNFRSKEFWKNSLNYALSKRIRNDFSSLSMNSPHWVIMLKNFLDIGEMPEKWQIFEPFERANSWQLNPRHLNRGSSEQLSFNHPKRQATLQLSPPSIPLFFARVQKAVPKIAKLAVADSTGSSFISKPAAAFPYPKNSLAASTADDYRGKAGPDMALSLAGSLERGIVFRFDSEIRFSEFKMQKMIVKGSAEAKASSKKLRPRRSSFRPHSIPDWVDMEMLHVDLSL